MDATATDKSIKRHREKLQRRGQSPSSHIPWGLGMGWPKANDFLTQADYIAARKAADPEYTPSHDGKLWAIV